jgi:hypothetical protein
MTDQQALVAQYQHIAARMRLEDDIRSLKHYLAFGYFCHPITQRQMKYALEALELELSKLPPITIEDNKDAP